MPLDDETVQVVLHPGLREPFEHWLHLQKLHLVLLPDEIWEGDLPTYVIGFE
jgi:hypothetical protein